MNGSNAGPAGRFLWGVATSAFQLEGSTQADWMEWDRFLRLDHRITNHWDLFRNDLALLEELGVNAYRFSLEWSRIQPAPDAWDEGACRKYRETVDILLSKGITPMVTLHHFTHPLWFIRETPWHKPESVGSFLRYAERLLPMFGDVIFWITFNEPLVLLLGGYLSGHMPPGEKDPDKAFRAIGNILLAHSQVYDMIHSLFRNRMVSIAHNMMAFAPSRPFFPPDRFLARRADAFYNFSILEAFKSGILNLHFPFSKPSVRELPVKGKIDFIGINYYTRLHLRFSPLEPFFLEIHKDKPSGGSRSDLGWEIYPQGLSRILRKVKDYGKPVFITENGIASCSEEKKTRFIDNHIKEIRAMIREGMDIRGYFYWSFLDNYEWLCGLDARFGLYRVNYENYGRESTEAARFYRNLIKSSGDICSGNHSWKVLTRAKKSCKPGKGSTSRRKVGW